MIVSAGKFGTTEYSMYKPTECRSGKTRNMCVAMPRTALSINISIA